MLLLTPLDQVDTLGSLTHPKQSTVNPNSGCYIPKVRRRELGSDEQTDDGDDDKQDVNEPNDVESIGKMVAGDRVGWFGSEPSRKGRSDAYDVNGTQKHDGATGGYPQAPGKLRRFLHGKEKEANEATRQQAGQGVRAETKKKATDVAAGRCICADEGASRGWRTRHIYADRNRGRAFAALSRAARYASPEPSPWQMVCRRTRASESAGLAGRIVGTVREKSGQSRSAALAHACSKQGQQRSARVREDS